MEVDVNSKFRLVPASVFKQKIASMLLKLNKNMGNAHTADEIAYVSTEIWKPIYFRNPEIPYGVLHSYFNDVMIGKIPVKKITVLTMLLTIQAFLDEFYERDRLNRMKLINEKENQQRKAASYSPNSPISLAAAWLITKRCDKYSVDHLNPRQVSDWIISGKNPEDLIERNAL